jgi:NADH-quinone oxidoreductase subunit I
MKVLDRFAIDYALCMYCGICVEVCPFDALFWSPEFEYAEYDIVELTHEKEKLEEWTYTVLPPPFIEDGAEVAAEVPPEAPDTAGLAAAYAAAPSAGPAPAAASTPVAAPAVAAPVAAAPAPAEAAAAAPAAPVGQAQGPAPAEHADVALDQETFERVLAELLEQGTDRRVAEGRARRAAMVAARTKAEGGS